MDCASCGRANRPGNRFCSGCGRPLSPRCRACGAEAETGAQFCGACGAPLDAAEGGAAAAGQPGDRAAARKIVTIVFADLAGSTSLQERLDAESVRRFMDAYYQAMRGAVECHGGTVAQLLGDGVKAVFGAPRVAEDDAIRAVRAAVAMQRAFAELAEAQAGAVGRTGLRVAVNTGEVVASETAEIIGDPVNVAARLQEQARDGDVVIGESTRRLVSELVTLAPLGVFALKGRSESVAAYRVVSLDRPAGASATPFVGREAELRKILAVYEAAVGARRARLAVVLGSPGLGKSRVIGEVARRLGDAATVLSAQCDAAGGATFAPIADALRACLRIAEGASGNAVRVALDAVVGEEADGGRIASGVAALLAGTPASPEETFFVVRRFLAALAAAQPVVLAIDDLQWAEPLLLDLTEHLVQWSTEVPLLVLVAARPELREARSSLASQGGLVAEVVTLAGLDARAAMELAANAIGADELPAAVAGRVLATSEGNPLFVGELVRMLVQDGTLVREGNRWKVAVELAGLEMPPTIQALLAARIERLRPEERTVLERAAVIGRQFSRAAVKELLPREIADFDRQLESLRRSELIEPDTGWFLGEPALRFHHVLIRDAAYRRLLKNTRAELHERFADWVTGRVGEAAAHDETLGWHLEQAYRHLRELGPLDAHGKALGERAANVLAAAGRRALARDDVPLAASLLGRALAALDAEDPARAELALDWCEALLAAGEVGEAAAAIDELGRFAGDSPRLRAWHTCLAGERAALVDPQALRTTADAVAAAAEELAGAGDAAGEAKAHFVHAIALARLGRIGACEAALDRALAAARRGRGDRRRANAVLSGAPQAALWGPSPVTRASGRCLDVVRVLRITQGAPAVEAIALRCQGVLEALRGRSDAARRMIATSRRMVEELGITQRLLEAEMFAGQIELIEGDPAAAEERLRPAYDGLREHGLGIDAAQAAALLGRALLAQGRAAEAETLSHESESLAGDDLRAAVAWRGVRAEALARRGEHAAAIEFARAAVEIAAATDALLYHADARTALAVALRAAGRTAEAAAEDARAIELWEAKGATLLVERARREGARVISGDRAPVDRAPAQLVRRIRPNAATAQAERVAEAFAARDLDALGELIAEDSQLLQHPIGDTLDREGALRSYRMLLAADEPVWRKEPLATLGDSLALFRWSRGGSGFAGGRIDAPGSFAMEDVVLTEVDARGRHLRGESFSTDHLGDAVVRLYERYAELLPDGPQRDRAAATARSLAVVLDLVDPERWATAISPTVEWAGQGPATYPSGRGAEPLLRTIRAHLEVGEIVTNRTDDILALSPNALVRLGTVSGIDRAGGGQWESTQIFLFVFGRDGLLARVEYFEPDRAADALARFDDLTAEPAVVKRRVRPNAATAYQADLENAVAARDLGACAALHPDDTEIVDHLAGATFGKRETLSRAVLASRDLSYRVEPLATLGDSLALTHLSVSASGVAGGDVDVARYASEEITLTELASDGRRLRAERWGCDHLGDAVVRLYERYAESLPAGPERDRAATTARSVALNMGPFDPDRSALAHSPGVEVLDHRLLATQSAQGRPAMLQNLRAWRDLATDTTVRIDDVLALRPDANLTRRSFSGTDRRSGGAFERAFILLTVFGADGLAARVELFELDREANALARFDALTAEPARRVRRRVLENAATANLAAVGVTVVSRDIDAYAALHADAYESVDRLNHMTHDRAAIVESFRLITTAVVPSYRYEPLATLGDSLALCRLLVSALGSGDELDAGAYEFERLFLVEVDGQGRRTRSELFATDLLGDAVAGLYERYAEALPAGPEHERAAATARSVGLLMREQPDSWPFAPAIERIDHRTVGLGPLRGADSVVQAIRALLDLTDRSTTRLDDVLGLRSDALLALWTHSGTDRTSGGEFERRICQLWIFGADGLITRWEQWEAEQGADALARFDELTAEPAPVARRVRPNAATALNDRIVAAISARDADALAALHAEDYEAIEHTTGATHDNRGYLAMMRSMFRARDLTYRQWPLATLGDSLSLWRVSLTASGATGRNFDVGPYAADQVGVSEVDASHRQRRAELFASEHLGKAVVRLYERYAELLPAGPERDRAAATARALAAMLKPSEIDRFAEVVAPSLELVDHRSVVGIGQLAGAAAYLDWLRTLLDVADDIAIRYDDVLASRPDALLWSLTLSGTSRPGGGTFERQFISLLLFGADGLLTRIEQFDSERTAEALARFDELTAEPARPTRPTRRVRPNAATAYVARVDAAIARRDIDAFDALWAAGTETIDHPNGTSYDREGSLATLRSLFHARDLRFRQEPLATLGDSLALCRVLLSASGFAGVSFDVGPYEREQVTLVAIDGTGLGTLTEIFGPDHFGDAVVCLYERYAELLPAGPERVRAAAVARSIAPSIAPDPAHFGAHFAPGVEFADHRALIALPPARGAELLRQRAQRWFEGVDDYVQSVEDVLDLRPDGLVVRISEQGRVRATGGSFEGWFLAVHLFDGDGQVVRTEMFDPDREAGALARFDELTAPALGDPLRIPPNAAARAIERVHEARDIAAVRALLRDGFAFEDRGKRALTSGGAEEWIETSAFFRSRGGRVSRELIGTRGDRIAIDRVTWTGVPDEGPFEIGLIGLTEVDAEGKLCAVIRFDADDRSAAFEEAEERFVAGEAAIGGQAPFAAISAANRQRDWAAMRRCFADDFAVRDHRTLSIGVSTVDELIASLRARTELSPDVRGETFQILAWNRHGRVGANRALGSALSGGGPFETVDIAVWLTHGDHMQHLELFDIGAADAALARFAELCAERDPLQVPPNAATRAIDRRRLCVLTQDWEAMRALCAPTMVYDDRRRLLRTTGDRDMYVASVKHVAGLGARHSRRLLATAGDRLALEHLRFTDDVGTFETDLLSLQEVDAEGRLVAAINFDPEDVRAASAEMRERANRNAPPWVPQALSELGRGLAGHDLARCRAALPDDFVFDDHRRTGAGRLEGADAYVASLAALFEQSPDAILQIFYTVALERHGQLSVGRLIGTLVDGGEFEIPSVQLFRFEAGRVAGIEVFELDGLDRARARFEELRPDPLQIPPNAASRALDRVISAISAIDRAAVRALVSDDLVFEDRGKRALTSGGAEQWIQTLEFFRSRGGRSTLELIGTRGDRIAIERVTWTGMPGGTEFEIELIGVGEVDAEGKLRASIRFDADDRAAAFEEAEARFAAGEAAIGGQAPYGAIERASNRRDWEAMRRCLADDVVIRDHRVLGVGAETGDELIASARAMVELSPDATVEIFRILAWNHHGRVAIHRMFGSALGGGGPLENFAITVTITDGDRIGRQELFDLDAADAALARFAELCAERDPLHIPPNAASRAAARGMTSFGARDHDPPPVTSDFTWEDRGKRALTRGGAEQGRETLEFYQAQGGRTKRELIGTRGHRIAINRVTWSGAPGGSEFEIEYIGLVEVDAMGNFCAAIRFDPDDRAAAFEEAEARFLAGEAAVAGGQGPIAAYARAFTRHDREALRACLAEEFLFIDRRSLGVPGTLAREQYLESVAAIDELAPDLGFESFRILSWSGAGRVDLARTFGTREGETFEHLFIRVLLTRGDRVQRFEVFDVDSADQALARFAELCAERA